MVKTYTPEELISAAKAYIAADAARMARRPEGTPRAEWRDRNPVELRGFDVRDSSLASRPRRVLSLGIDGNPYDLTVWAPGLTNRTVERINLRAADAADRLAKYEREEG